jgi:lipoate-protein ligase A
MSSQVTAIPIFPGRALKNDALFLWGSQQPLPWVLCYEQTGTEVVHGPACKAHKEVFVERCERNNIPVRKRRGGGGTVVLSKGMVIVVVVGHRPPQAPIEQMYRSIHQPLIACMEQLGIDGVCECGISDLAIGDKKICGSSLYLSREPALYYYQSSIMVSSDLGLINRYLAHPPREPDYRKGRPHSDFCTTLHNCGHHLSATTLRNELHNRLPDLLS